MCGVWMCVCGVCMVNVCVFDVVWYGLCVKDRGKSEKLGIFIHAMIFLI